MKFSIIICLYNEEQTITKLLESLYDIDYLKSRYEIILINDGSTDRSRDKILNFLSIHLNSNFKYYEIKHAGLSVARNTGVKMSNNEVVLFIDADALADKDILNQYKLGFSNEYVEIATGKVKNLNLNKKEANFIYSMHNYPSIKLAKNKIIGANMAYRKKIFDNYLFFDFFVSRGDETALIKDIQKDNPQMTVHYFQKAIVYNETASSINEWLNKIFIEGENSTILLNFFSKQYFLNYIAAFIKFIFLLNIPIMIFSFFIPLYIIIFSLSFFFLRIVFRLEYIYLGIKSVFIRCGFLQAVKSLFIINLGIIISDIGSISPFFTRKKLTRKNSLGAIYSKNI